MVNVISFRVSLFINRNSLALQKSTLTAKMAQGQIRFMNLAVDEFDSKNYAAIATLEPVCANNYKKVVVLTILLYSKIRMK